MTTSRMFTENQFVYLVFCWSFNLFPWQRVTPHTHTHTHTYAHMHTHTRVSVYVCMCLCKYIFIYKQELALNNKQDFTCYKTQPNLTRPNIIIWIIISNCPQTFLSLGVAGKAHFLSTMFPNTERTLIPVSNCSRSLSQQLRYRFDQSLFCIGLSRRAL